MTFPINTRATDMHELDAWTLLEMACDEQEDEIRNNTADAFEVGFYDMRGDER